MSTRSRPTQATCPADGTTLDGTPTAGKAPASSECRTATLLTPRDVLSRLNMNSTDPAKWMRRTFVKHGVPYIHACGKLRATEAQYQLLLEKITCSPSVPEGKTGSTIS